MFSNKTGGRMSKKDKTPMKNRDKGKLPANFPKAPSIVLVKPQLGDNIGKAARAMLNCGFTDLRIVDPRDGWPNERAEACCSGAYFVIDEAKIYNTTKEAVADKSVIFGSTARFRELTIPTLSIEDAATKMINDFRAEDTAILFGCERSGLDNDDIALCDYILNIPLNPEFSSLNLSQAVLLICYSWFSKINYNFENAEATIETTNIQDKANKEQLYNLFDHFETELDRSGCFKTDELKPKMVRNIHAMLSKADLTSQEVQTLHGMIVSLSGNKRNS